MAKASLGRHLRILELEVAQLQIAAKTFNQIDYPRLRDALLSNRRPAASDESKTAPLRELRCIHTRGRSTFGTPMRCAWDSLQWSAGACECCVHPLAALTLALVLTPAPSSTGGSKLTGIPIARAPSPNTSRRPFLFASPSPVVRQGTIPSSPRRLSASVAVPAKPWKR